MVQAQARPAFLEVDLTSAQGVALRRSVSEKYGPTIVEAASLAERMFLLRSPWAPGLRFIGAETRRAFAEEGCTEVSFSLSGSGETLEDAFVSCVGEGIDRLAQVECPTDVTAIGNVVVQGLALGHLKSVAHAREVVRHSFQTETIVPHADVWNAAYNRLAELFFPDKGDSAAQ